MRIGLIGCSAGKLQCAAPARELYIGPLFSLCRAWIEPRCDEWAILSARHGLVMPDDVIEPYDDTLATFTRSRLDEWADSVRDQLMDMFDPGVIYLIAAGERYRCALRGMPFVEDVFGSWAHQRRERGLQNTGIGILKRELKRNRGFGI